MAARKQVLRPGKARRTRGESRKLHYEKVRARLLSALEQGAHLPEACGAAGVTARQVRFYAGQFPEFRHAYNLARRRGLVWRALPPENVKRFLVACKWLCGIDVAREAMGLTKAELVSVFATRPDICKAAKAAQAEGRKLTKDENGELTTRQIWGRAELRHLVDKALAMEALS